MDISVGFFSTIKSGSFELEPVLQIIGSSVLNNRYYVQLYDGQVVTTVIMHGKAGIKARNLHSLQGKNIQLTRFNVCEGYFKTRLIVADFILLS